MNLEELKERKENKIYKKFYQTITERINGNGAINQSFESFVFATHRDHSLKLHKVIEAYHTLKEEAK